MGGFIPTCHTQTFVELAKLGFDINLPNKTRNEMNSHIIVDNASYVYECEVDPGVRTDLMAV